jgi:hypothetical protein
MPLLLSQKELAMLNLQSSVFLRRILFVDAATSAIVGLSMAIGADFLAPLLGLPVMLLREAGLVLLPFAVLVTYAATRAPLSQRWTWAVIICNALWVVDSAILLLSGWVTPTALGQAFVVVQAVVVGIFAEMQYFGVRKSPRTV